jgi:hypothetical protein
MVCKLIAWYQHWYSKEPTNRVQAKAIQVLTQYQLRLLYQLLNILVGTGIACISKQKVVTSWLLVLDLF